MCHGDAEGNGNTEAAPVRARGMSRWQSAARPGDQEGTGGDKPSPERKIDG